MRGCCNFICRAICWPYWSRKLDRLGALAGGELDRLAGIADRNPPALNPRNRRGEDAESIDYHPAYREMERLAFGEFGLAAMSHRAGVFGWPKPLPPAAKYALTFLFAQAEFGLLCPVNMTDSLARALRATWVRRTGRALPAATDQPGSRHACIRARCS